MVLVAYMGPGFHGKQGENNECPNMKRKCASKDLEI